MMCYQGCRYEVGWGDGAGECSLPSGKMPPIDAMCSINELQAENEELRELVRNLVYATHPIDRAKLIENAVELGIEVDA